MFDQIGERRKFGSRIHEASVAFVVTNLVMTDVGNSIGIFVCDWQIKFWKKPVIVNTIQYKTFVDGLNFVMETIHKPGKIRLP